MIKLAAATIQAFDRRLERVGVAADEQPDYRRWVHFYLDFCAKYGHEARDAASLRPFLDKLASKGQTQAKLVQASKAVDLLLGKSRGVPSAGSRREVVAAAGGFRRERSVQAVGGKSAAVSWEREFEKLHGAIRMRNYSDRTGEAYRHWVGRFQAFVGSRPSAGLSAEDVRAFLTDLAVGKRVSASSQPSGAR